MYQILVQLFSVLFVIMFAGPVNSVFYIPGSVVSYPKMGKRAFYTNETGNRYPLMGRRSSPTGTGTGVAAMSENSNSNGGGVDNGNGGVVMESYNKRGVFTQGPHRSFPRVGRSGSDNSMSVGSVSSAQQQQQQQDAISNNKIRSEILKTLSQRLNRNVLDALEQQQQQGEGRNDLGSSSSGLMAAEADRNRNRDRDSSEVSGTVSGRVSKTRSAGRVRSVVETTKNKDQVPQFFFLLFDTNGDDQLSRTEFTSGLATAMEQNLFC